jgi:hypothetical protein
MYRQGGVQSGRTYLVFVPKPIDEPVGGTFFGREVVMVDDSCSVETRGVRLRLGSVIESTFEVPTTDLDIGTIG